jgi:hypothetical protein
MLLFGEGALVYKIFDWSSFNNEEKTEMVVSDDNRSLKESITKQVKERVIKETSNIGNLSATVKNIYVDHNVVEDGLKGMQIAVEFESKNLKDETLYCMIRFYNDDGSPLVQKNNNNKYRSLNGNVIVGEYTSPTYDDCKTRTTLFIPYKELPKNAGIRTDLILDASILHYTTNTDYEVLDRSKTYSFYLMDE